MLYKLKNSESYTWLCMQPAEILTICTDKRPSNFLFCATRLMWKQGKEHSGWNEEKGHYKRVTGELKHETFCISR